MRVQIHRWGNSGKLLSTECCQVSWVKTSQMKVLQLWMSIWWSRWRFQSIISVWLSVLFSSSHPSLGQCYASRVCAPHLPCFCHKVCPVLESVACNQSQRLFLLMKQIHFLLLPTPYHFLGLSMKEYAQFRKWRRQIWHSCQWCLSGIFDWIR